MGIPWVSSHEVNLSNPANVWGFVLYYLVALLLSILIEGVVNYFMLRKRHQPKRIISATILVNLASYLLGSIVLYAFSMWVDRSTNCSTSFFFQYFLGSPA